ncbi:MAG: hypothetical protein ACE5E6_05885 [Phycisphaerae bacterium]
MQVHVLAFVRPVGKTLLPTRRADGIVHRPEVGDQNVLERFVKHFCDASVRRQCSIMR